MSADVLVPIRCQALSDNHADSSVSIIAYEPNHINVLMQDCGISNAGVRRYFDPHDIFTPGSKYRNDILTPLMILWPPL